MATTPKLTRVKPREGICAPSPDSTEHQVLEVFRELLAELGSKRAAEAISLHSSLDRDLGLGSLERVELLVRCEARFRTRLADEVAQEADTPADWVHALRNGHDATDGVRKNSRPHYQIVQPEREAPPAPESARDWVEVLRHHADVEPDRVQVHLLEEDSGQDISYGKLLETASHVAAALNARGLRRDETVAIMLPTCADFFYAFLGVMMAGGIAVPVYPPSRPDKIEEYVRRQVAILRNAEVRFLITFDRAKSVSRIMRLSIPSLVAVTSVEELLEEGGRPRPTAAVEPSDTAFLQYTSGSTGDPKGVVLSHSNVLANVRGIGAAVEFRPTDIVVSWLPLYHDMGLIGSWLFSVYFGAPATIFSPLAFLGRPERWLWAMHDSGGTLCPAPNFAYELCARKIPDGAIQGLDLSSWRVAINAGEAVLAETLDRFANRFAPYGFRPESYVPCYGLAESSVALVFPPTNRRPVIDIIRRDLFESEGRALPAVPTGATDSNLLRFVGNGAPMPGHDVKLLDEEGHPVGERTQGRLFFRGLSQTSGYYRNPEATAEITTEDGWMDSGDLAYWADGELFITGRSKDLIIKSGRNIIPQEVEAAAADVQAVRRGCVAAFGSVDPASGTERLIVVAETRSAASEDLRRIEAEIVRRVDAALGIPPDTVVLVPPQSIPKTSSGKIRRTATRSLYEQDKLRGAKRPPWVQIVRLWSEHFGAWLNLTLRRISEALRHAYSRSALLSIAAFTGVLARILPDRAAARIVRSAARWVLRVTGSRVAVERNGLILNGQPAVFVANRAGCFDPLVLAATLPAPFLVAEPASLRGLPGPARFMLRPLLAPPVYGETAPRGGTLRQRIHQALEDGQSVLVLPDGPPGVPAQFSRFRLDALDAAAATSSVVVAIGVLGTDGLLEGGHNSKGAGHSQGAGLDSRPRHPNSGREIPGSHSDRATQPAGTALIRFGGAIDVSAAEGRDPARIRQHVRAAIAQLCDGVSEHPAGSTETQF